MAKQKLTFEQSMARLEQIVGEIEQGRVPLEKSIERYAEGIELIKHCRGVIERAEEKIRILAKGEGGALEPAGELADAGADGGEEPAPEDDDAS